MAPTTITGSTVSKPHLSALTALSLRKNGSITLSDIDIPQIHPWKTSNSFPGKHWHTPKSAFRPRAGQTSYTLRATERKATQAMKAKEKSMKDEKAAEREVRISHPAATSPGLKSVIEVWHWNLTRRFCGRGVSRQSRIGGPRRRRKRDLRRWRRPCIGSAWKG